MNKIILPPFIQKMEAIYKTIISTCIEEIIIYCSEQKIDYTRSTPGICNRFLKVYNNEYNSEETITIDGLTTLSGNDPYCGRDINKYINSIGIDNKIHKDNKIFIENMLMKCLTRLDNQEEIGICCFCEGECNPMSQSCGSCARGLSGVAIGIPVPPHLRKFL